MQIKVMNGGFSRVSSGESYDGKQLNGYSRVNVMNGYTLNGVHYSLNGVIDSMPADMLAELTVDALDGDPDAIEAFRSMNGIRDWIRKRKQNAAARKARRQRNRNRREVRKDQRIEKRDLRKQKLQAKIQNIKSGNTVGGKLAATVGNLVGNLAGQGSELLDDMDMGFLDDAMGAGVPGADGADTRGLFKPPSLFKDPGKWFSSNKVPGWQKAGVVVLGVAVADKVLNKGKLLESVMK